MCIPRHDMDYVSKTNHVAIAFSMLRCPFVWTLSYPFHSQGLLIIRTGRIKHFLYLLVQNRLQQLYIADACRNNIVNRDCNNRFAFVGNNSILFALPMRFERPAARTMAVIILMKLFTK